MLRNFPIALPVNLDSFLRVYDQATSYPGTMVRQQGRGRAAVGGG